MGARSRMGARQEARRMPSARAVKHARDPSRSIEIAFDPADLAAIMADHRDRELARGEGEATIEAREISPRDGARRVHRSRGCEPRARRRKPVDDLSMVGGARSPRDEKRGDHNGLEGHRPASRRAENLRAFCTKPCMRMARTILEPIAGLANGRQRLFGPP